jgi:hypothetical protein
MPAFKVWIRNTLTIRGTYTKTGTAPPLVIYNLKSGSTNLTNISSTGTDSDLVEASTPLTASVLITAQSFPTTKTVTINLIVKNITDGTTLYNPGATGFTTVGTGYTYQWTGDPNKIYEVTASASNT